MCACTRVYLPDSIQLSFGVRWTRQDHHIDISMVCGYLALHPLQCCLEIMHVILAILNVGHCSRDGSLFS